MKKRYKGQAHAGDPLWQGLCQWHSPPIPRDIAPWLTDKASLTARLRSLYGTDFSVRVLQQTWMRPQFGEAHLLSMQRGEVAWVREVHLLCRARACVFARTVIPRSTLQGRRRRLARLGARPLGEVLFADPSMRRDEVQIARIDQGSPLYRTALQTRPDQPPAIWGRRSVFHLEDHPLLVSEIFLPGIEPFPEG